VPGNTPDTARAGEVGVLFRITGPVNGNRVYIPEMREECGLWEVNCTTGATRWISLGFEAYPRAMALSPDGATLHVSAVKGLFNVDMKTLAVTRHAACEQVHQGIAVSNDGTQLYCMIPVLESGGAMDIFDAATLERLARVPIPGHSPFVVASAR
jgi:hypothetical protein